MDRGVPNKGIYAAKLPRIVPQRDILFTAIISCDRPKLYLKIYTPKNEILGTRLLMDELLESSSAETVFGID